MGSRPVEERDAPSETEGKERDEGERESEGRRSREEDDARDEQEGQDEEEHPEDDAAGFHDGRAAQAGRKKVSYRIRPDGAPMTDLLWMPEADGKAGAVGNPNYVRTFDAKVQKALEDWILLDRTAFYAEGGGQPSDVGRLTWDGGEAQVKHVSKRGAVKHTLQGELPPAGAQVHGEIDWTLRHQHMRMHTSQHILSGVVFKTRAARTVGNQLHAERSRIDFEPAKFSPEDLRDLETEVNRVLALDLPVRCYEQDRSALEARISASGGAERNLLNLVPQSVKRLRIVEVYDPDAQLPAFGRTIDVCPCAGTHVARTGEIGRVEIIGRETKGEKKDRVEYLLKDGRSEATGHL